MAQNPFLDCRTCGLPAPQHATSVVHRFVRRPDHVPTNAGPVVTVRHPARPPLDTGSQARLQHGVNRIPTLVRGCHHASITTVADGRLAVRVASGTTSRRADQLQDELDEGPSLQVVRTGHGVVAHDLGAETRWLAWCEAATEELTVRSVLSVLLVAGPLPTATLNLYSDAVDGLAGVDLGLLHTLAGPLADALLDERVGAEVLGPAA